MWPFLHAVSFISSKLFLLTFPYRKRERRDYLITNEKLIRTEKCHVSFTVQVVAKTQTHNVKSLPSIRFVE